MLGLSEADIVALWERRVEVLAIRQPKWIVQSIFAPLLYLLLFLAVVGFSSTAMVRAALAYVPFLVFSIGLYVWVKRLNVGSRSNILSRRKAGSIYGSFDISMLSLLSSTSLLFGLVLIQLAELNPGYTLWISSLAIALYIVVPIIALAYSPKLLLRRAHKEKASWRGRSKWLQIIPNAMIGVSLVAGTLLARLSDSTVEMVVFSAIAFFAAFSLLPIIVRGFVEVEILLLSGFDFDH